MKQIGERWDLMYERWGFSAKRRKKCWMLGVECWVNFGFLILDS